MHPLKMSLRPYKLFHGEILQCGKFELVEGGTSGLKSKVQVPTWRGEFGLKSETTYSSPYSTSVV